MSNNTPFIVTEDAMRPASHSRHCFYCNRAVGDYHKDDCVLVKKKIRVKVTLELDVDVPHHWPKEMVEFHYNESSWCANNLANWISEAKPCLCGSTEIEVVSMNHEAFIEER